MDNRDCQSICHVFHIQRNGRIKLWKKKETDEAIKLALEVGNTSDPIILSQVYRLLGQIYMQQGNKDEAQKSFLRAFRASPTNPECIQEVGKYFADTGDTIHRN